MPFDRIKTTGLRIVCDYPNGYTKVVALFNAALCSTIVTAIA